MRRAVFAAMSTTALVMTSGCAAEPMPTYSQVREETLDVLRQVAAFIPEPKQISETPEFAPYPCDEELAFGTRPGGSSPGSGRSP